MKRDVILYRRGIAELAETKNDLQKEITEKKGILAEIKDFFDRTP